MLLRKGVYPYEYIDDWKFNETALTETKKKKINKHWKRVCKDFEIKHFGEYRGLYLRSDVLLLADVFENFREFT